MNFLPAVIRAEYRGEYRIHLAFNDGAEGTVDFSAWLRGPVFEPLTEPSFFQRFFLDGGTVSWPNGADIAPETLYEKAKGKEEPNTALQLTAGNRQSEVPSREREVAGGS